MKQFLVLRVRKGQQNRSLLGPHGVAYQPLWRFNRSPSSCHRRWVLNRVSFSYIRSTFGMSELSWALVQVQNRQNRIKYRRISSITLVICFRYNRVRVQLLGISLQRILHLITISFRVLYWHFNLGGRKSAAFGLSGLEALIGTNSMYGSSSMSSSMMTSRSRQESSVGRLSCRGCLGLIG